MPQAIKLDSNWFHRLANYKLLFVAVLFAFLSCSKSDLIEDIRRAKAVGQPATVGGTVSGLAGTLVLQNNGERLTLTASGSFVFVNPIPYNAAYAVTVVTNPVGLVCTVSNGSGTMQGLAVTSVQVFCSSPSGTTFSIGGTVSGLSGNLTIQNNRGDMLVFSANTGFTFGSAYLGTDTYTVTVFAQPAAQLCTIANASGPISSANVTNIAITCATNAYTVGGNVSGLSGTLVLRNNGGNDLVVNANGGFTFSSPVADTAAYNVTILSKPSNLACNVTNAAGTISGGNVTNVSISCSTTYTIGGSISGLSGTVVLQNNLGDNLSLNTNAGFTFATPVSGGYSVTVLTQPAGQTCTVNNPSGTPSANVTNVSVVCANTAYTAGGSISGLSGTVVLRNNGGDDLTTSANGGFTFATPVANGAAYNVTVFAQPAGQGCTVFNGSGTISGANVTGIVVSCVNVSYTVGGTMNGVPGSPTWILLNNGADSKIVSAAGAFTFGNTYAHTAAYNVTVYQKPAAQNCLIQNGSGTINAANVTNVVVSCAVPPAVNTVTPANLATDQSIGTTVSVTFSTSVAAATVTVQAVDGACTGSFQVATSAAFTNCVGGTLNSSGNPTFVFTPGSPLANGVTYYVRVTTAVTEPLGVPMAAAFNSSFSTVLTAPTLASVVRANAGELTLTWSAVPNATSYNVYWATAPGVTTSSSLIASVTSPYTHTGLANGVTYYYRVKALNAGSTGAPLSNEMSQTAYVTPGVPTISAIGGGISQLTVSWGATANATSYNIYWATSPGVTTASSQILGATSPYVHSGLTNGTTYYYRVSGVNTGYESALSAEVSRLVGEAPVQNAVQNVGTGQLRVSWAPVNNATSYNIYWATAPGVTMASSVIAGASNPYTHTGLTDGVTYYYRVTALNGYETPLSNEQSKLAAPVYATCNAHKLADPGATDGVYTISPVGTNLSVYCDMTTDGGGWTLIVNRHTSSDNFGQPDLNQQLGTFSNARATNWQYNINDFWGTATQFVFASRHGDDCPNCAISGYHAAIRLPKPAGAGWSKNCNGTMTSISAAKLIGPGAPASLTAYYCQDSLGWASCAGSVCKYGCTDSAVMGDGSWGSNSFGEMHFPSAYTSYKSYTGGCGSTGCRSCAGGLGPPGTYLSATCCNAYSSPCYNDNSRWTIWVR